MVPLGLHPQNAGHMGKRQQPPNTAEEDRKDPAPRCPGRPVTQKLTLSFLLHSCLPPAGLHPLLVLLFIPGRLRLLLQKALRTLFQPHVVLIKTAIR